MHGEHRRKCFVLRKTIQQIVLMMATFISSLLFMQAPQNAGIATSVMILMILSGTVSATQQKPPFSSRSSGSNMPPPSPRTKHDQVRCSDSLTTTVTCTLSSCQSFTKESESFPRKSISVNVTFPQQEVVRHSAAALFEARDEQSTELWALGRLWRMAT